MNNKKICISKNVLTIILFILLIFGLIIFSKQLLTEKLTISSLAVENQTICYPWDLKCLFCRLNTGGCKRYTTTMPTPTSKPIITPSRIVTPTINPNNLRLEVIGIEKNGEYIGDAHIDFYDGSVKKYYGFFYAFAGDQTSKCLTDGYKITPIGNEISITERIPTFSLKSERTNNGVTLYFLYQQKRYDLFTMAKNANHIVIGIDNSNIPNVYNIACLED